ncbi:MAG: TonB family protein [Cellvibrionaceae bacterium]
MATTVTPAPQPTQTADVSSSDRLSFTVFLAIALHGLIIFGIAFELSLPDESAPSVTVTLATHESKEAPEEADFVAQANQIGSGTLEEAKQITTDQLSPFSSETIEQTQLLNETRAATRADANNDVITTTESDTVIASKPTDIEAMESKEGKDTRDIQNLTQEIASLNAKLDKQRQQYAKRPRERVLTSVSTKTSRDAAYLNDWTRKVEVVGNENFPREAISQRITGELRLQSVIRWDGALIKAEILDSSGHRILDDAALQIIHRAAPFLPFPPDIRKDTDQLVIIRTWHFEINGLSTSQ